MSATLNQQPQALFADGEVVTTTVLAGSAEYWIVVIAIILLAMKFPKALFQFPYRLIIGRKENKRKYKINKTKSEIVKNLVNK